MKRKLAFQSLESRKLLAVDLLSRNVIGELPAQPEISEVFNFGAVAYVVGTEQANGVIVEDDAPPAANPALPALGQLIEITDQQSNGSAVISRYRVDSAYVVAYLGDGDDIFVNYDSSTVATAYGGDGEDVLVGVHIGVGGAGNDRIEMMPPLNPLIGFTFAIGGTGDDTIIGSGSRREFVDGGAGIDTAENVRGIVRNVEFVNQGLAEPLTEDDIDEFFERLVSTPT